MARGGGLRKGLTLGLAAGVGVAVARAARARRAAQPAAAPPTWPPLPTPAASQPPAVATTPAARPDEFAAATLGSEANPALVAEAAVLEASGVTEAAEVDQEAVVASQGGGTAAPGELDEMPAWGPPPADQVPRPGEAPWASDLLDDFEPAAPALRAGDEAAGWAAPASGSVPPAEDAEDVEAVLLAEEAALEAERLEAERLELARLERTRLQAEEEVAAQARREREREEALARFATQREEAQALLALQEEREARAADGVWLPDERQPMMAGDLPGRGDEVDTRPAEAEEPAEAAAGHLVEDDHVAPSLEPVVPDDAVADLDEEPPWGAAVDGLDDELEWQDDEAEEPELPAVRPGPRSPLMADDLESGLSSTAPYEPQEHEEALEPLSAWPAAAADHWPHEDDLVPAPMPAADLDEDFDGEVEAALAEDADDAEPALAEDAGGEPALGEGLEEELEEEEAAEAEEEAAAELEELAALADEDLDEEVALREEDLEAFDELEDEDLERLDVEAEAEAEDEIEVEAEDEVVEAPVGRPAAGSGRRPIMTMDFDDVLPAELDDVAEEEVLDEPVVRRQRSGRPRVPLKAHRAEDDDAAAASSPPTPSRPARTGTRGSTRAAAGGARRAADTPAAPGTPAATTKAAEPATAAGSARKAATPAKKPAPAKKQVSTRRKKAQVLWVEPVGAACPTGYPVKANSSSGIFHLVGGLFYDRTRPDRCYRDPEAAIADGLRQAKR